MPKMLPPTIAGLREKQGHAHSRTWRAYPRGAASAYGCPDDALGQRRRAATPARGRRTHETVRYCYAARRIRHHGQSQKIVPAPGKRFRFRGSAHNREPRRHGSRVCGAGRSGRDIFRRERGYHAIGYKIAGTNPASRAHLQIDAPFFGRLYDGMASRSPGVLPFIPNFLRVHEPEIAIEISRDLMLSEAPFDAAAIEAATRAVIPAIEIIGTYFDPWAKAGAPNLASDNAALGHWIMGLPVTNWSGLDLLNGPVTISIDGEVRGTGKGSNVDDGAFGATAWLANALAARGIALKAGDYVTTGSVTPPIPVQPGQRGR